MICVSGGANASVVAVGRRVRRRESFMIFCLDDDAVVRLILQYLQLMQKTMSACYVY